ncbi:MAG: Mut7-C RNAse domain-containing protein [Methanomassiliicoccales archaeon]|jgi:uncharacterized protein with PIN domain
MTDERPKFSADEMLGSLSRWLRIMGYDTTYEKNMEDADILRLASAEDRILLTRDKDLVRRAKGRGLYVESDELSEQLSQVFEAFDLSTYEALTRCTVCNGDLVIVQPNEVKDDVPVGALDNNDEFYRCTKCGKIYWKGSHWDNILNRLGALNSDRSK